MAVAGFSSSSVSLPRSNTSNDFDLPPDAIESALTDPPAAIAFGFGRRLAARLGTRPFLETTDRAFDIDEFVRLGHATIEPHPTIYSRSLVQFVPRTGRLKTTPRVATRIVHHGERRFDLVTLAYPEGYGQTIVHYLIGDDPTFLRTFFEEVCAVCHVPDRRILVFAHGCFTRSERLFEAVEEASFDDLVLADGLGERIRNDVTRFLSSRDAYTRFDVPYKRGILLVGPPGNGKTHCLRAILNHAKMPILYVKSVKIRQGDEESNVASVFEKARSLAPCVLVLEDLDSLITRQNLSSFLNEMDGLAGDTGILTLATTNHPEVLDVALLERPSRFDRKYHFDLPGPVERRAYAAQWNEKLDAVMRVEPEDLDRLAEATGGFSFAYLKELFVSSMLRWMEKPTTGTMPSVLHSEVATLAAQQSSVGTH